MAAEATGAAGTGPAGTARPPAAPPMRRHTAALGPPPTARQQLEVATRIARLAMVGTTVAEEAAPSAPQAARPRHTACPLATVVRAGMAAPMAACRRTVRGQGTEGRVLTAAVATGKVAAVATGRAAAMGKPRVATGPQRTERKAHKAAAAGMVRLRPPLRRQASGSSYR